MKKHRFIFTVLAITSFASVMVFPQTASAKAVKTPSSLRGTWYHYDSDSASYEKIHATKYHFKIFGVYGTSNYSGVKFPSYASGHADMFVHKTAKGYYQIGKYGTDDVSMWKRVTHKDHTTLKQPWHEIPDTGTYVDYWYKTKATARQPNVSYKVAKTNGFYFEKYSPAYLQADYGPQKLYTSAKNAQNKRGSHITVKSIYKKYSARWDNGNKSDVLRVRLNSKTYYIDVDGEFQPYNSWKDGKTINSPYSPHSNSKIVIRHGDKFGKANYWDKVVHYRSGTLATNSWKLKNGGWVTYNY